MISVFSQSCRKIRIIIRKIYLERFSIKSYGFESHIFKRTLSLPFVSTFFFYLAIWVSGWYLHHHPTPPMFRATFKLHKAHAWKENYESFLTNPSTCEDRYSRTRGKLKEWQIFTYFYHRLSTSSATFEKSRNHLQIDLVLKEILQDARELKKKVNRQRFLIGI